MATKCKGVKKFEYANLLCMCMCMKICIFVEMYISLWRLECGMSYENDRTFHIPAR